MTHPNTPVRGKRPGVAAVDVDGGRYCLDCAVTVLDGRDIGVQYDDNTMESIRDADGEKIVEKLVDGRIYTLSHGGVVLKDSESTITHCGRHKDCEHSISGDEHDHDHDERIGGRLALTEEQS